MKTKNMGYAVLVFVFFCTISTPVMANNQNPNLNWGYTDFMDAAIPGSGWIFNPKVNMYSGNFVDAKGNDLPGKNELNLVAFSPQLIYVGKSQLPGGLKWGVQGLWTAVGLDVDSDLGLDSGGGIAGDLCVGPFIGSAIPLAKDWIFHWFFEFDVYAPVGSYNKDSAINASANFWTFEPFLAMTLQMPYGFEISTRQHFAFNTTNDEYINPALTHDFRTHDMKAGDLWHCNFTFSKSLDFISPFLRFGLVGYYGQQINEDEIDGVSVPDSEERVLGIGPGAWYTYIPEGARKPAVIFSLKSYWESRVENRTEGNRTIFRLIIPF